MESLRKMLVVLMTMVVTVRMVNASLVYVGGGKETWRPNVNFSEWSARQNIHAGDWLYFGFDKKLYNVLEVNKTGYEGCHDVGFIKNITRGGRDVFQVNEAKTYYFINGGGSCFGGLKVAINVENPQPAPSPSQLTGVKSIKNGSPSRFGGLVVTGLLPTGTCFKICMFWHHLTLPRSSSTRENEKRSAKTEVFSLKNMLLEPVLHRVGGGKYTWAPNMNFTAWAMHEEFYADFGFDKTRYSVLEVNRINYNNCNDKNCIANITRGGRDVFNLIEARPYYFLSGRGYCFKGMKVVVHAQYPPPDPAPLAVGNVCPSKSASHGLAVLLALFTSYAVMGQLLPLPVKLICSVGFCASLRNRGLGRSQL
ncbi:hypothetical protein NC652_002333 [Populus alba x Populus x berolinensis]|nr:hypothetical protein NC652_002333 [Populus alba x Populus x berolinensis]